MSFSALYVNKEIEDLTPYKYLDSLDTTRFRDYANAVTNGAQLHAYTDFLISLLMGEGIVVPENQFIDSLAFLDVAAQLIQHARRTDKLHLLSLRVSLFSYDNPYDVAAKHFGNPGFVLSGWPYLSGDVPRRALWRERLSRKEPIPTTREYAHPDELPFIEKLNIILEFFNDPQQKSRITKALPNKQTRLDEIDQVANLSGEQIHDLVSELDVRSSRILIDTVAVMHKLQQKVPDVDVRSSILKALVLEGTPEQLNPFYFDTTHYPVETHRAVLSVVDSIYNYATGIGVQARLISHTARASAQDTDTPSFYALALWTRLTNKREKEFVLNTPNGLIVPSGLQWHKVLQNRKVMEYIAQHNFPWDVIFEATSDAGWRLSLNSYLKALNEYHACQDSNQMKGVEERYLQERARHLDQSKHRIPHHYYEIQEDRIDIRIAELQKMIEEETRSTGESSQESSQSRTQDAAVGASLEGKVGGELGLTPKVTAEVTGKLEGGVTISNGRHQKQSTMLRSEKTIKHSQLVGFEMQSAQKLYAMEKANAAAIKGVIAAIEDALV